MIPQSGLTEAEFEELSDFLLSDQTPEECMDISMLDGFLTCLAIGPETIPPSQWLPVVWGETEDEEMVWESQQQAQHIYGLLMAYYNEVSEAFQYDPPQFELMFYQNQQGEPILDSWCEGFMRGLDLSPDLWNEMAADDEASMLLGPMITFGTDAGCDMQEEQREEFKKVSQEKWAEWIERAVLAIHDYWLPYRKSQIETMTQQAASGKIGRNAPCPCGSGKKFKHCCMN